MSKEAFGLDPAVIEGIGPVRAAALRAGGVETLGDMLAKGPGACRLLMPGTSARQVRGWIAAARLMCVVAVEANVAEALVAGGIHSVEELARATETSVLEVLEKGREERLLRDRPDRRSVRSMLRRAERLAGGAVVLGRVVRRDDDRPVAGAQVHLGRKQTTTDEGGRFAFVGLSEERHLLRVEQQGRRPFSMEIHPRAGGRETRLRVQLAAAPAGSAPPRRVDELERGALWLSRAARIRLVDVPLESLPAGALLVVRDADSEGRVKLLHLHRRREGNEIRTDRARVLPERLPAGAARGSVLRWDGMRLELTELSQQAVARKKLESVVGPRPMRVTRRVRRIEIP